MTEQQEEFDFIVSGAGSAGCVVAARLSESGKYTVLLLEAGPEDKAFWIGVPLGFPKLFTDPAVNWMLETEPVPELNGRRIYQPRGKVLGGTSSINGMVYIRGHAQDYDLWRQRGCVGWSYEDVLPYFKMAEDQQRGADPYHGVGGPLTVSDQPVRCELTKAMVEAAQQAGIPYTPDFNGARQEGVGFYQTTTRKNRRLNTARAYLRPARRRRNLRIVTGAHATRVLLEERRATGIEYRTRAGLLTARARREVILAGGAFGSPHLLQLSGIGPAFHLREFGIAPKVDLPHVGANLMDHFQAAMTFRCTKAITVNDMVNSWRRRIAAGVEYVLFKRGPLATNGVHAGIFTRADPEHERPNIQINTTVWSIGGLNSRGPMPHPFPAFTMVPVLLNPCVSGTVRLRSPDPLAAPKISQNFLYERRDIETMIAAVRIVRSIVRQPALAPYVAGEIAPGVEARSDAEIEGYLRASGTANLHPVGSCRMGTDDAAVVDPRLRVRGIHGLRVADASIMPTLPAGNTNAPSIMIGEKASAMILEDARASSPLGLAAASCEQAAGT